MIRISINNSGNVICKGNFTNGSGSFIYAGGLRLGGSDTSHIICSTGENIGITVDNGYNINFTTLTGVTNTKMSINSAGVGIQNTAPWIDLNIDDCSVSGSSGTIGFGKTKGAGNRNFRMGMRSKLFFVVVIVGILIIIQMHGLYNLHYHIKPRQAQLLLVQLEQL